MAFPLVRDSPRFVLSGPSVSLSASMWRGGHTDIDELTMACDIHHALVGSARHQWRTRKNRFGYTEWIPPKLVDPQQRPRVNHFHHPERRLRAG